MTLGMLLLIGLAVAIGVIAMRLSWRLVNKLGDETALGDEPAPRDEPALRDERPFDDDR